METNKHYLMVGSFVIVTLLATIAFSVWLVGAHDKSAYMPYRILFAESVSGLDIGSPVKFRGMQVGKVETISIDPIDTRFINVSISILKTTPVKTDTVASLTLQGITGDAYIQLSGGTQQSADLVNDKEKRAERIPEIRAEPSTLDSFMNVLPKMSQNLANIAAQTDKLFSNKNISSLDAIIANLEKASHDIIKLTQDIEDDPSRLIFSSKKKEATTP
jgi:phospholipid/cholesterol/gamma-HCH transport system substrate-binding protein